jgi:hypothetical protein
LRDFPRAIRASASIDPASEPERQPTKPCVYVGMTGLPVEQEDPRHHTISCEAVLMALDMIGLISIDFSNAGLFQ